MRPAVGERVLLRGGYVLSMDDEVGELPAGDVLVEDGAIAAVAPEIDADGRRAAWTCPGTW